MRSGNESGKTGRNAGASAKQVYCRVCACVLWLLQLNICITIKVQLKCGGLILGNLVSLKKKETLKSSMFVLMVLIKKTDSFF